MIGGNTFTNTIQKMIHVNNYTHGDGAKLYSYMCI